MLPLDPEWQLAFKAVAGIASPSMAASDYDPLKVWLSSDAHNMDKPDARELTTRFEGHYKSDITLNWENRHIKEVSLKYPVSKQIDTITMI